MLKHISAYISTSTAIYIYIAESVNVPNTVGRCVICVLMQVLSGAHYLCKVRGRLWSAICTASWWFPLLSPYKLFSLFCWNTVFRSFHKVFSSYIIYLYEIIITISITLSSLRLFRERLNLLVGPRIFFEFFVSENLFIDSLCWFLRSSVIFIIMRENLYIDITVPKAPRFLMMASVKNNSCRSSLVSSNRIISVWLDYIK